MDLVEVVLRAVDAERYLDTFRHYNIGPDCLKLLSEQDLEIMNIQDATLQKKIIEHCKALVTKIPEKTSAIVDASYIKDVLENMDKQLYFHYNNLVLSAYRNDVIVYNVKLGEASKALRRCVGELKIQTKCLKGKVIPTEKRSKGKALLFSITSIGLILGLLIKHVHKSL